VSANAADPTSTAVTRTAPSLCICILPSGDLTGLTGHATKPFKSSRYSRCPTLLSRSTPGPPGWRGCRDCARPSPGITKNRFEPDSRRSVSSPIVTGGHRSREEIQASARTLGPEPAFQLRPARLSRQLAEASWRAESNLHQACRHEHDTGASIPREESFYCGQTASVSSLPCRSSHGIVPAVTGLATTDPARYPCIGIATMNQHVVLVRQLSEARRGSLPDPATCPRRPGGLAQTSYP